MLLLTTRSLNQSFGFPNASANLNYQAFAQMSLHPMRLCKCRYRNSNRTFLRRSSFISSYRSRIRVHSAARVPCSWAYIRSRIKLIRKRRAACETSYSLPRIRARRAFMPTSMTIWIKDIFFQPDYFQISQLLNLTTKTRNMTKTRKIMSLLIRRMTRNEQLTLNQWNIRRYILDRALLKPWIASGVCFG